jgi:signal transduction histidine kinase
MEETMFRKFIISAIASVALALTMTVHAQAQSGTAAEAKAMLEKAVAAVTADKDKALVAFNAGTDGFKDRDLYPFCFNLTDGTITAAPPSVKGKDVKTLKDPTGKAFGEEIYKAAQDGKVNEVSYMFPRPGTTEPVAKVSFVTKAGDQGCGVGYYK